MSAVAAANVRELHSTTSRVLYHRHTAVWHQDGNSNRHSAEPQIQNAQGSSYTAAICH